MQGTSLKSLVILLFIAQLSNASFFGCGCRQCACAQQAYASYQPSYQPAYASYYPSGRIAGYILRPVGPAPYGGYATPGGYGGNGIPVIHNKHGQIGYLRSDQGYLPANMPVYWQPAQGAPYETVSLGRFLL